MKNLVLLVTATLFFSSFSQACDNETVQKTLEHFCTELSKLKPEQIASIDALPEKNLQFNSCGQNGIVIYSSQEPYKIIRYPLRSWNNNAVEFGRGVGLFSRLTKESLSTKKMATASIPYGAVSFDIQKTHFVLACEGIEKNYPYLIATAFLTNTKKEQTSALYFQPAEYEKQKSEYDAIMDSAMPFEKRSKAFDSVYDKMVDDAIQHLVKHFSVNKDIITEVLKNEDTKRRAFDYLLTRFVNDKIRFTDVQGAIQTITETIFTTAPLVDTSNKNMIELEATKKTSAEMKDKLKALEAATLELGKPNNYTYAVVAAVIFLLTSIGLLIALIKK